MAHGTITIWEIHHGMLRILTMNLGQTIVIGVIISQ
jgi:hypothetical protein